MHHHHALRRMPLQRDQRQRVNGGDRRSPLKQRRPLSSLRSPVTNCSPSCRPWRTSARSAAHCGEAGPGQRGGTVVLLDEGQLDLHAALVVRVLHAGDQCRIDAVRRGAGARYACGGILLFLPWKIRRIFYLLALRRWGSINSPEICLPTSSPEHQWLIDTIGYSFPSWHSVNHDDCRAIVIVLQQRMKKGGAVTRV